MSITVKLLSTYKNFTPYTILDLPDDVANALLANGVGATTDLTGGVPAAYSDGAAYATAPTVEAKAPFVVRSLDRQTVTVPSGRSLKVVGTVGAAGVLESLNSWGGVMRSRSLGAGELLINESLTDDRDYRIRGISGEYTVSMPAAFAESRDGLNRAPGNSDNASAGYTANSVWQARGKIYQPTLAPTAGSAVWGEVAGFGGSFTDIMGAATISAWGTVAMKTGFTGPAVDITVTVGGAPVVTTLNILANGELDNNAAFAAIGKADAGTFPTCTQVYDQSGAGNHWTKDPAYPAPYFVYDPSERRFGLTGNGPNAGAPRTLRAPNGTFTGTNLDSGFGVASGAFTVFAYARGNAATTASATLFALGDRTLPASRMWSLTTETNGRLYLNRSFTKLQSGAPLGVNAQAQALTVVCAPTTVTINVNEDASTETHSDTNTYSSGWLFCYSPAATGNYASHMVFGFGVAKAAATAAQAKALRYSAYARFDIRPQVLDQVFMVGDSRTASRHPLTAPFMALPTLLAEVLGKDYRIYGLGSYGAQTPNLLASGTLKTIPFAASLYNPAAKNVATFLGGVNDVSSGASAAQTTQNIKDCVAALKAAGMKVVLCNELATNGASAATLRSVRSQVAGLGASGMGADTLIDLLDVEAMGTPGNTSIYADGLHPTGPADQSMVSVIAKAI